MCQVLGVSRSGYYAWRTRTPSAREMANQSLVEQIKQIHAATFQVYGSPRMHQELQAQGYACSPNRVARLMRQAGICAKTTRRYKGTTQRDPTHAVAANVLDQQFWAEAPNQRWLCDLSYIPTREGWLYLACVLDLYSRRIVGWAMNDHMSSQLVHDALRMALRTRRPAPRLLHHSDRGSQYTATDYQALLRDHAFISSMSATGNCYDNAPMESFFGTLKREWVHHHDYHTRQEATTSIFFYIESFYNRRRRHSALGYLSPLEFEAQFHQSSTLALCPSV